MPEIDVGDDQIRFLEGLAEELAAEHAGEYATVRPRDALQFLIDRYEGSDVSGSVGETEAEPAADGGAAAGPAGGGDRLAAMMNLVDDHADKWEETDAEGGKYAVSLPDGSTEQVRTKDDVRALLFKHYR